MNDDKCCCECKELIDSGVCDKGYTWNPSNCECEFDKSCDVGEKLQGRKRLKDELVEECNENTDEAKLTEIALFESTEFYTVFIVLDVTALTTCIDIGAYYTYKYMES